MAAKGKNCEKTNITVFGNRKCNKYMVKNLEMVDCFKYLAVNFNFNGNFSRWKKELSSRCTGAMYSVMAKRSH